MSHNLCKRDLKTRTGRSKLASASEPYWCSFSRHGLLGYRKDTRGGVWLAHLASPEKKQHPRQITLGKSDDNAKPDGAAILTFHQALAKAHKWFLRERERVVKRSHSYTVADAAQDYVRNYLRDGHYRMHDGRRITTPIESLAEFHIIPLLGHIPVAGLTRIHVRQWVQSFLEYRGRQQQHRSGPAFYLHVPATTEEQRKRQQTANRALSLLKSMLNEALREGRVTCDPSPWREVPYFRHGRVGPPRFISLEEQRMLIAACEGDFRKLVMGALYTGARFEELAQLRAENFVNNAIYVPAQITKTRKPRRISLEPGARRFFEALVKTRMPEDLLFTLKGHRWRSSVQWQHMRAATLKAELTEFPFQALRNTAATNWVHAGIPLKYISEQLGNSLRMCELHYAHVAPDHRCEVFSKLPSNCIDGLEGFPQDPRTLISPANEPKARM